MVAVNKIDPEQGPATVLNARISQQLFDDLDAIAVDSRSNRSEVIRRLLADGVQRERACW